MHPMAELLWALLGPAAIPTQYEEAARRAREDLTRSWAALPVVTTLGILRAAGGGGRDLLLHIRTADPDLYLAASSARGLAILFELLGVIPPRACAPPGDKKHLQALTYEDCGREWLADINRDLTRWS